MDTTRERTERCGSSVYIIKNFIEIWFCFDWRFFSNSKYVDLYPFFRLFQDLWCTREMCGCAALPINWTAPSVPRIRPENRIIIQDGIISCSTTGILPCIDISLLFKNKKCKFTFNKNKNKKKPKCYKCSRWWISPTYNTCLSWPCVLRLSPISGFHHKWLSNC
jgi:hypothetical protein